MPGLLTAILQAGATLVLDASAGADPRACQPTGDEVVVCARPDRLTTRLPMEMAGHSGTVLIEPSGPRNLLCNPDFIARARITGEGPVQIARVGAIDVMGGRTDLSVKILDQRFHRGVQWSGYRVVEGADCIIGPLGMRYRSITFTLGRDRPDAVDTPFPFDRYDRSNLVYATLPVGAAKVAMRIELAYETSVVTAPAARIIAPILGGRVTGPTRSELIINGVTRPVRTLELLSPLNIGPVRLSSLSARVLDYGRAANLRTLDPEDVEAGAVVVTSKAEPPGRERLLRVGRDALAGCVSVTVDLRQRQVVLRC